MTHANCIGNEILGRKQGLGELLARQKSKTLAEGIGETVHAPESDAHRK